MAFKNISQLGEDYIRSKCNGTGKSKLQGSAADKRGYSKNPTAILPYCYPITIKGKIWTSNPAINGGITTNGELGDALIKLYNKYGEEYEMNANIMVAQAHQESEFIIWNYAINSSASGLSQFIAGTIYDVIANNKYGGFTNAEILAITKGMSGYTYTTNIIQPKPPFVVNNQLGRYNRPILHQNIIDNIDIMIKAQFEYMKYISTRCGQMVSCALFGYNRGPFLTKSSSYSNWINAASNKPDAGGKPYEDEGIGYVYKIFKLLYEKFGYNDLNITNDSVKNFDSFKANLR